MKFHVVGLPAPGGSKNAFAVKKGGCYTGAVALVDAGVGNKAWRNAVRTAATLAKVPMIEGPVSLTVTFFMPRPKSHYGKGQLKASAPLWHLKAPDVTKLMRSTEDSLKGLAWIDDCQVVVQTGAKMFSEAPGAEITITSLLTPE